jgi:hypothetical protein
MATNDYINTLLQLDTSSLQFPEQLDGVLGGEDFGRSIEGLEPEDSRRVVELLDKVLCFRYFQTLPHGLLVGPGSFTHHQRYLQADPRQTPEILYPLDAPTIVT